MATENNPRQAHPGIVVIDVSDPKNPRATAYLADTAAALNPHETNKVNEKRGLLGLAQSNGPNFAVYDLNGDCAHPRLASSITVPNSKGHMGGWAEDGKTFYIGQNFRGRLSCRLSMDRFRTMPMAPHLTHRRWSFMASAPTTTARLYASNWAIPRAPNNSSFDRWAGDPGRGRHSVSPHPQTELSAGSGDQGQVNRCSPSPRLVLISIDESGGVTSRLAAGCARGASPYGLKCYRHHRRGIRIVSKIMLMCTPNCTKFVDMGDSGWRPLITHLNAADRR
jgi:hypothetical protein